MKALLTNLILIFAIQYSYSQIEPEWVAVFTGPEGTYAQSVAVDLKGNVYVTGRTFDGVTSFDFITIKYNNQGVVQWVRTYNGTGNFEDLSRSVKVDNSGNIYVMGSSWGSGTEKDYLIIKYDSTGTQSWVRRYNGPANKEDEPSEMTIDGQGNIIVTGFSTYLLQGSPRSRYTTIKYNPNGDVLWVREYIGPAEELAGAYSITVDNIGNVYVTGFDYSVTDADYVTIKYSSDGNTIWTKRYNNNGTGNGYDSPSGIVVDSAGNVYVTGESNSIPDKYELATIKYSADGNQLWLQRWSLPGRTVGIPNNNMINLSNDGSINISGLSIEVPGTVGTEDFVTIKYNSEGLLQWYQVYNGNNNSTDFPYAMRSDKNGNIFVAGRSNDNQLGDVFTVVKYDALGVQKGVHNYLAQGYSNAEARALETDQIGNIYATGWMYSNANSHDITTIKYPGELAIIRPRVGDKWIAGETDTIRWTGGQAGQLLQIEFSNDNGSSYQIIDFGIDADSGYYIWQLNDTILSTKAKIKLTDMVNNNITAESDSFKIKPYVLTRVDENGNYYEYRKDRDQWGFSNTPADMWDSTWYSQFYYQGTDPFTGSQYSQWVGDLTFINSIGAEHPDWISWVNTFSVDACYFSTTFGIYRSAAVLKWSSKLNFWGGSCFGIAAASALAFGHREEFNNKYPNYPNFINPITVASDTGVKRIVNELFTHQYGNPTQANDPSALAKTPNQTLEEIRQMLLEDTAQVRTLSIYNNGGSSGHTILAYGLKQDPVQKNLFYVQVYDNSNPNSNNPITIDTLTNGGTGSWSTLDWAGWGGNGKIHLEIPSLQYLSGASFPKQSNRQSAFILPENVLEINNSRTSQIRIVDGAGNVSGYINGFVLNEIPDALPLIVKNGSETPPYGYSLPSDYYSVELDEFEEDTISTFFFTGNKSFMYERSGADQTQTDRLFFDGGVSVTNPDAQSKTVKLLNLINETTQEKLFVARSLELAQNDSVKIENPDSNKVKLISYGTAKEYDLELNYVTENGIGRFGDFSIPLSANSSHTFVPVWTDLTNSELQVLVDIDNDGTIDDTLSIVNQVTGIGDDQGTLLTPNSYKLAQNFPNPFNPTTTIQYSIPQRSNVTLKVYDVLGNEIAALVNEAKDRGVYSVNFDASQLASGIYLYRIQAGSFVETKKMILLK